MSDFDSLKDRNRMGKLDPVSEIAWKETMKHLKNTLDQWEEEATKFLKETPAQDWIDGEKFLDSKRILALIDLVRKKDEALKSLTNWFDALGRDQDKKLKQGFEKASKEWHNLEHQSFDFGPIKEALALTEKLK